MSSNVGQMTHFRLQVPDKTKSLGMQRYVEDTNTVGLKSMSGRYGNALLLEQGFNKEERFAILSRRAKRELVLVEAKPLSSGVANTERGQD